MRRLLTLFLMLFAARAEAQSGVTASRLVLTAQGQTIADNGSGTAATGTLTVSGRSYVPLTCSDANGCTVSVSETGAVDGQVLLVTNLSANAATFADSSGVVELATGTSFAAAQYEGLFLQYQSNRWVEISRTSAGSGGAPTFTTLGVGTGNAYTSPSRILDVNDALSGSLGSTAYAAAQFTLSLAATGGAPSGQSRAFQMNVTQTGTVGNTGEISAALFNNASSTSGTITEENGGLFAVQRSVGTSTTSQGIRVDRNYSSAATVTNSRGINIQTPSLTGGATIGTNIGLLIANQGATSTTLQLVSSHANSGYWNLYGDGSFDSHQYYTGGATSGYHFRNLFFTGVAPSANTPGEAWVGVKSNVEAGNSNNLGMLVAFYGSTDTAADNTVDAWSDANGGGVHGFVSDANHYGTSTLGLVSGFTAWGGTGTGATVTNYYGFYVPKFYEYSGTVTNKAGVQIDDQSTGATGVTNNFALRIGSPNTGSADQGVMASGAPFDAVQAVTIADNGGGTNATATITPTAGQVEITCSDADGCDVTLGESGIVRGQRVTFINLSVVVANFADTATVSEAAAGFAAGQYDTISFRYISDRWVETSRSNN